MLDDNGGPLEVVLQMCASQFAVCKSVDLLDLLAIFATFLSHYTVQTLTVLRRVAFATFSLELLFSTENLRHFILKTHWLSSSKSTLTSLCSFKHGFYDYN